jgi:putative PEP-CTERM system histidine kinase
MAANLGVVGYAVAAALYLLLSLQLLWSWRGRLLGGLLALAAIITLAWTLGGVWYARVDEWEHGLLPLLEALRNLAWFVFMLGVLGLGEARGRFALWGLGWVAGLALVLGGALILIGISSALVDMPVVLPSGLRIRHLVGLASSVIGLVLVEQIFRNARPERRWGIKFFCLGVGAIYAYDFFLYSDALLFQRLDSSLAYARGLVAAMAVPLLALAAARNPHWSVEVFVSRQVVFHSVALLGTGVYLLAMAAGGYYLRFYGGSWGGFMQAVFLAGAALLLLVLLFSGQIRARLQLFLSKHFYRSKYDYRDQWMRFTAALAVGAAPSRGLERVLEALGELVDSPGGQLWLRRPWGRFEPAATRNMTEPDLGRGSAAAQDPRQTEDASGLVSFLSRTGWVIDLREYAEAPEGYPDLNPPAWLRRCADAWLVVPLPHRGQVLGFVVLSRSRAMRRLNWEDYDLLKTAAYQAAGFVAQHQADAELAEARQFEAFSRLTTFVVHDLKNIIAQLSLLTANADRHKGNPEFMEDALDTVRNSVEKMQSLLEQLRSGGGAASGGQRRICVELCALARRAVAERARGRPVPSCECPGSEVWIVGDPERLTHVLGHLVSNALEAVTAEGRVAVEVARRGGEAVVTVEDNGIGMDAEFIRDRLFRPFDSTKGRKGMGIGVYQSRETVVAQGGRLEVDSRPGQGSRFRLLFPCAEDCPPL